MYLNEVVDMVPEIRRRMVARITLGDQIVFGRNESWDWSTDGLMNVMGENFAGFLRKDL